VHICGCGRPDAPQARTWSRQETGTEDAQSGKPSLALRGKEPDPDSNPTYDDPTCRQTACRSQDAPRHVRNESSRPTVTRPCLHP
jgi:hypothetical protein